MLQQSYFSNFSSWLQSFSLNGCHGWTPVAAHTDRFFFSIFYKRRSLLCWLLAVHAFDFVKDQQDSGFTICYQAFAQQWQHCQIIPTIVDNSHALGSLLPYGYAHFNWVGETLVQGKVSSSGSNTCHIFLFNKVPTYSNGWMIPSVTWTFVFGVVQIINWMTVTRLLDSSWRVVTIGLNESNP